MRAGSQGRREVRSRVPGPASDQDCRRGGSWPTRHCHSLLNSPELRFVCEKVRSGVDGRQVGEVMRFVREGAVSRPDGEDFAQGCAELRVEGKFRGKEFGLAAVDGEGGGAEQVLKGPG